MTDRRRTTLIVAGVTVLAVAGATAGVLLSTASPTPHATNRSTASPDAAAVPTPSATPTSTPPVDAPPDETRAVTAVTADLEELMRLADSVLQNPDADGVAIDAVAAGFVKGEIEALAAERRDLGYRQVGQARVVSVTPTSVDLTAAPPSMQLAVCIDASAIDVLDADGNSLKAELYDPGHPVLHLYGAQLIDGDWKIATHDIPDDPTSCL